MRRLYVIGFSVILSLAICMPVRGENVIHLAVDSISYKLEFEDSSDNIPIDNAKKDPSSQQEVQKNWTEQEKNIVIELFKTIEKDARGLLIRATAYENKIKLKRAFFPLQLMASACANNYHMQNHITFTDSYFLLDKSGQFRILAHELAHLIDYGKLIVGGKDWPDLVGSRCGRIRSKIMEDKRLSLSYNLTGSQWNSLEKLYGDYARQQGMPNVYSCTNLHESLAGHVEAAIGGNLKFHAPIEVTDFIQDRLLSTTYKPQIVLQDYYKAISLSNSQKYTEAINEYSRMIMAYPEFVDLYGERSWVRYMADDDEGALADLDRVVEANLQRDNKNDAAIWVGRRAYIFRSKRNYKEAVTEYSKALEYRPELIEYMYARGLLRLDHTGDPDGAIVDFSEVLKLSPESLSAYLARAKAFEKKKNYAFAEADMNKVIELAPDYGQAYFDRASYKKEQGVLKEAVSDFTRAIELNEKWVEAYYLRAKCKEEQGDFPGAISDYNKGIELHAKHRSILPNADIHAARGIAYVKAGVYDKALADLQIGMRDPGKREILSPWYQKANNALGVEVINVYEQAIAQNPTDILNYLNKASALMDKFKRYDEAIIVFEKAIELKPKDVRAYYGKGLALSRLARHEEAIMMYDKTIELVKTYPDVYYMKGNSLAMLYRTEEAITLYDKVIELNPKHVGAYYRKGIALNKTGKHEDGLKMLEKLIELSPKSASAYHGKGYILLRLNRYDEAIEFISKALAIDENNRGIRNTMATALFKRNIGTDTKKATEISEQILKEDPKDKSAAYAYANLGRKDEMLVLLKNLLSKDDTMKNDIRDDIEFDPYRAAPQFKVLVGK